jgi:predicted DNA-binding protein (MmcQ/YjbR family)
MVLVSTSKDIKMSAITVRTMLAMILENNLQMDDEIHFDLSDKTDVWKINNKIYHMQVDLAYTETVTIKDNPIKQFVMLFDLSVSGEE